MMISSAIANCTVPVMRGSSHGPIATPCSTRARVSVMNVMMAAPATAPVSEERPPITSIASNAKVMVK